MKLFTSCFLTLLLPGLLTSAFATAAELPKDLKWQTHSGEPSFASQNAKTGGTLNSYLLSFPLTLRNVGPDSNGAFRQSINDNQLGLVTLHPNTEEFVPALATHWAVGKDGRSVYYRLNPKAKWSDGKPVKATDFTYTIEFMRSKEIVAPWYNQYYSEEIEGVETFKEASGTEVVLVRLPKPKPDIVYYTNITPTPRHFYKLDEDFVRKYNWEITPNTGPYQISKVRKGKSITFERKKDWWAKDLPFFKNRFNVDRVIFKVIRDPAVAFENLKKGNIDFMDITWPEYWHEKTNIDVFQNGYIHKAQFYNDAPRSDYLLTLNLAYPLFQDRNVRLAFHHAMNVDKVIHQVLRGDYSRLQGISQGYGDYTNPSVKARDFDLEKADDYLKKAGWTERNGQGIRVKDGKTLTATISYGQSNVAPRLVVLREEAKKAGIELKLKQMDPSALWNSYLEKKHEIAFVSWGTQFRPQYWGQYHSANANKAQTNNLANIALPKLDKLIEDYRGSTDKKKRQKTAYEIQQIVHEEAISIPLFEVPYYRLAYWPWLKFPDVPSTKTSDRLDPFNSSTGGLFWIDSDAEKEVREARRKGKKLKPVVLIDETFRKKT